ncbi:MAG TPA: UDP-3-O-(3-hydroxymyristoyl)glucosamine N-acyltransferase [Syntrophorhabdaceae bacterium]|nr:UDP-3-O-(3-hydroxymyristoyl)glucosamine N-acyltransferase [Syntrophorhabdaceae bacterium]HPC66946.1 UDP-3-O-(3-hydroxymyristoyl)glucosamine N-acyltransferase [Syntrophorhabdaceae bacterium]HQE79954.1 UDP-3-O-(3-hydroxymyristoyl)glucosamine N-acyltransferase [Syntrophorhabdaceae bacterium]HQH43168.1 UDP-3-O-(3-hydroxymyristoyl)glucosamine N-acyltransferase [Syntrophorhabdaceae bacterium]HQK46296.1 UDP-3-O-(3-hydroxymyristoyl)glucosamine N-acyltransferase [Syntrophorhabdaceae bacterium]
MITLKDISEIIGGDLRGDGNVPIYGISGIQEAKEGEITFLMHAGYERFIDTCQASAIIVSSTYADRIKDRNIIVVKDPQLAYIKVAGLFDVNKKQEPGISPLASVSKDARVADDVSISPFVHIGREVRIEKGVCIYPFVYIGDSASIGEDTVIYPGVTIYARTEIGKRVIIHAGSVIGADGFGYVWDGERHCKIPQLGKVVIEDDVEIGANVTIDRASLDKTVIKRGTKIDNLVQIAHNVTIGENSIIVAQVGIAGSSKIGRNVILAGQVGVRDHVVIGDNVRAGGQTGITKDVKAGSSVSGTPHMPHKEWLKLQVQLKRLPELFERMKKIEEKLFSGEADD